MSGEPAILVARLSALGDVVLASAVAQAIAERAAAPEFLAADPHHRILEWVPGIARVHAWEGGGAPPAVRDRRWDVVIDLSGTGRSRRLLAGVRAARRLRIRKQTLRRMAFVRLHALGADGRGIRPALDRMFDTVAPLGVTRDGRRPRLAVPPPAPDGPVLLAPGAGRDTKRWPAARFAELARRLGERGVAVRVAGSAAERELLEEVAAGSGAEIAVAAHPGELPRLVAGCPVAVTNDSALLHIAEACGAAVVALFGPTHPRLGFAPLDPGSVVVETGLPCRPCDLHGPHRCPLGHHRCMLDLPVERVLACVQARCAAAGRASWD